MWHNSTYVERNLEVRQTHPWVFLASLILLNAQTPLSMLGNLLVIYLTLRTPALRSKTHNMIIFGMALSDLLFSIAGGTVGSMGACFLSEPLCISGAYFTYTFGLSSFWFPAILAVNRYIAMYRNYQYEVLFSWWRVLAYIGLNFMVSALIMLPYAVLGVIAPDPTLILNCAPQPTSFLLHLFYNIACNAYSILAYALNVWFNKKNIAKLRENQNNASGLRTQLMEESERLIKMMIIVSVVPLPLQGPAMFFKTIGDLGQSYPLIGMLSIFLFHLPSAINPYIILYVVRPYRTALKTLLRIVPAEVAPAIRFNNTRTVPN